MMMDTNKVMEYLERPVIQQYKSDVAFKTLVDSVNDNMYVIPKYQRKYRWNREQVEKLVESLIRGFPIPPIYTYRNSDNQLEILDGQQRVMSLFFYYIGYFLNLRKNSAINFSKLEIGNLTFQQALMEQFQLEELHIQLSAGNNKKIDVDYATLPKAIKRKLDYTTITVIEIKIDQMEKREEVLRTIFANLNKGGVILSDQEQRNGVYNCEFYDMLQQFNSENAKWRSIWGRENSKEKDMEMLLRFCSLRKYTVLKNDNFVITGYQSSYAKLLDQFSEEALKFTKEEIQEYKRSLEEFVDLFCTNTTFSTSVALLESFYVIFEKKQFRKKITKGLCDAVQASKGYTSTSRQGTINMKRMNERWKVTYDISSRYN